MIRKKRCIRCGQEKPITDFYTSNRNKDGFRGSCKSCFSLPPLRPRCDTPESPEGMKYCHACGQHKLITDFYIHRGARDGRRSQCKLCYKRRPNSRHTLERNPGEPTPRTPRPADGLCTIGDCPRAYYARATAPFTITAGGRTGMPWRYLPELSTRRRTATCGARHANSINRTRR